jgi:hypothetical protein
MRGGDTRHQKVPADEYFVLARAYIQHNTKLGLKTRIFLATDDQTYISTLPSELKELIAQQPDVSRTGQGGEMKAQNAFLDLDQDSFKKGYQVLFDTLALSKSDFLLKCHSGVGEFAIYFEPRLHNHSFSFGIQDQPRPVWAPGFAI